MHVSSGKIYSEVKGFFGMRNIFIIENCDVTLVFLLKKKRKTKLSQLKIIFCSWVGYSFVSDSLQMVLDSSETPPGTYSLS